MDLVLIRHGLPERREDTADPPLTPEGVDQALRVAQMLSGEIVDAIYSSTMLRAIQTAEPYAALSGLEIQRATASSSSTAGPASTCRWRF